MSKLLIATLALCASTVACAQTPAPNAPNAPNAKMSPQTAALVKRVLAKLPLENVGVAMLQAPVAESLRQARALLQGRVSAEKQEAAMRDIALETNKFLEANLPTVRSNAEALIASTVAPLLAQRMSDEELEQLAALLESPAKAKFEALLPSLQSSLGEQLGAATQAQIKPKLAELQERIGLRMRSAIAAP